MFIFCFLKYPQCLKLSAGIGWYMFAEWKTKNPPMLRNRQAWNQPSSENVQQGPLLSAGWLGPTLGAGSEILEVPSGRIICPLSQRHSGNCLWDPRKRSGSREHLIVSSQHPLLLPLPHHTQIHHTTLSFSKDTTQAISKTEILIQNSSTVCLHVHRKRQKTSEQFPGPIFFHSSKWGLL